MILTMTKRLITITNAEELEREERRVIKRLKKQEAELAVRIKQLPEEVITVGVVKLVSGIVEGGALKSVIIIIKKIGTSIFSSILKDQI